MRSTQLTAAVLLFSIFKGSNAAAAALSPAASVLAQAQAEMLASNTRIKRPCDLEYIGEAEFMLYVRG
ncbi:hypothetical protein BST61_g7871 [Cercospora zeina]